MLGKVRSHDEWTRLEEVIVGRCESPATLHFDRSFTLFFWENVRDFVRTKGYFLDGVRGAPSWPKLEIEQSILDELNEDLDEFVRALTSFGVTVQRPAARSGNTTITTPFWTSEQSSPLNVRDNTIVLGETILETAPHVRARLFENDFLKPLFSAYHAGGARWLSMPRPSLARDTLDDSYHPLAELERCALGDDNAVELGGLGRELVFDGAQCLRLGRDVLVNVANRNHELGLEWLVREFGGELRFHRLDKLSDGHIDSTLLPLRPGLWLARSEDTVRALPAPFKTWDVVVAPQPERDLFPDYSSSRLALASRFIDLNVLSLDERTVVANSLYPELIRALELRGITVVPVRHRHRRLVGGGFHCFTIDVRRQGNRESYT